MSNLAIPPLTPNITEALSDAIAIMLKSETFAIVHSSFIRFFRPSAVASLTIDIEKNSSTGFSKSKLKYQTRITQNFEVVRSVDSSTIRENFDFLKI